MGAARRQTTTLSRTSGRDMSELLVGRQPARPVIRMGPAL
jgi:hypothetical protein